jgi:hypothetical protein
MPTDQESLDIVAAGIAQNWELAYWKKVLDQGITTDTQFIGMDFGLEWAASSKHVCGCSLSFDLPRNRWQFTLGADPCGDLQQPVHQCDYYAARAVAKACLKATKEILKWKNR